MSDEPEDLDNEIPEADIAQRNLDLMTQTVSGQLTNTDTLELLRKNLIAKHKTDLQSYKVALSRAVLSDVTSLKSMITRVLETISRKIDLEHMTVGELFAVNEELRKTAEFYLKIVNETIDEGLSEKGISGVNIGNVNIDRRSINVAAPQADTSASTIGSDSVLDKSARERVRELIEKLLENRKRAARELGARSESPAG